ncbi:hypothetical protein EDC04DRAFT_2599744 [Pisolithus marmoratus]|nr:hypothetical protein EDC04DRAFT_2599744 [Pisolithus marmoratus]
MPPMTRGMARKGVRHYAPYNLRSRGPNQTLLDLSSPPSTPRTPVRLHNAVGARGVVPAPHVHAAEGNPLASANDFIYPDIGKAIRDGVPPVTVGFAVKTRFIQDCLELVKVVEEEQKKILRALEADEIISQERLEMFGRRAIDYVDKCAEIAVEALANEIENLWITEALDDKVLEWLVICIPYLFTSLGVGKRQSSNHGSGLHFVIKECASQTSSPPGVGSQDGADDRGPVIQDYISSRPSFDGGTLASFSNASDLLGQDAAKPSLRSENESSLTLCFAMNLVYSERVIPYNIVHLKEQIWNGPTTYPGTGHVRDTGSSVLTCGATGVSMHFSKMVGFENGIWRKLGEECACLMQDRRHLEIGNNGRLQHRKLGYDSLKEDAIEIGGYYILVGSISTWLTMPKGRSMPYDSQRGYPYTPALRRQDLNLADSWVHTHNSAAKIIPTEGQLQHKCSPNVNTVSIIKVPSECVLPRLADLWMPVHLLRDRSAGARPNTARDDDLTDSNSSKRRRKPIDVEEAGSKVWMDDGFVQDQRADPSY